jgi:hypothetical protein
MSTNFAWAIEPVTLPTGEVIEPDDMDPRIHIGKRSNGFSWAQDPKRVEEIASARPDEKLISSEYGQLFTWAEFCEEIEGLEQNTDHIGVYFC